MLALISHLDVQDKTLELRFLFFFFLSYGTEGKDSNS